MDAPRSRHEIIHSMKYDLEVIFNPGSIGKDDYRAIDDIARQLTELRERIVAERIRRGR